MSSKLISIIIPTFNRNELLSQCLSCLESPGNATYSQYFEVIVTDDSKDDCAKNLIAVKFPSVKWTSGPKKGPAANRNHGASRATGKWLLFTDDDCLPQENWVGSYLDAINTSDYQVLEGKTIADRPKARYDEESPINMEGNNLWSCNYAITKTFFDKVGRFDSGFPFAAMEDTDFYQRVLRYSKILFLPEALVVHPWRRMKPFKNFKLRLYSHRFFATKYKLKGTAKFRYGRLKIFIGSIYSNFIELSRYSMKGWLVYVDTIIFNFCMIFI
jgi:GT2 family glycosyltransferase